MGLCGWTGPRMAFPAGSPVFTLPELTIAKDHELPWAWGDSWEKRTGLLLNLEEKKQQSGVGEALSALPSIQVPRQGLGSPPVFLMRGMEGYETRVFLEDIPLTDPVFSSQNIGLLPALAVTKVEVNSEAVPASLLSDGLSGAINLRVLEHSPPDKFLATVGSYGFIQASASAKVSGSIKTDLEYAQSDENFVYLDNNATPFNSEDDSFKKREHNGFKKISFFPRGKWQLGKTAQLSAFSLNAFQDIQIPGPIQSLERFELKEFTNVSAVRSQLELTDSLRIDATAYGRYQSDQLEHNGPKNRNSQSLSAGARTALLWKTETGSGKLGFGPSFSEHQVEEQTRSNLLGRQWELPVSLSGYFRPHKTWECLPSLLASRVEYQTSKFSETEFAISPRFSTHYYWAPHLRTRGTFGKFFRFPTLSEKMGNLKGIEANPELSRETALKAELGFDFEALEEGFFSEQNLSYSFFWTFAENLISFSQSTLNSKRAENIGRASWIGQEVIYKLKTGMGVTLSPSLQWLWTENQSDLESEKGKKLPNRFPLSAKVETLFEGKKWVIGHRGSFFSTSYLDRANQRELSAYAIHDLFARFESAAIGKIQVQVQNLFNLTLANSSWSGVEISESITGIAGYPDAGRRMSVTWVYDI